MQIEVRNLFPRWSADVTLAGRHGANAATHAAAALHATDLGTRLDESVRTLASFDHALAAARDLPVTWFVPGVRPYLSGYDAARAAVQLLLSSKLVPDASARVGRQLLRASRESFTSAAMDLGEAPERYERALASGWLAASMSDAMSGLRMLTVDESDARALVAGVTQAQKDVRDRRGIDPRVAESVNRLFDRIDAQLVAPSALSAMSLDTPEAAGLLAATASLLTQAQMASAQLARDAATAGPARS